MNYKLCWWSIDYNMMVQTIKIDFIICLTVSWKRRERKTVREGERGEREMETERARGKGAESVLTSIQEEDILSFYAAHVIFIA